MLGVIVTLIVSAAFIVLSIIFFLFKLLLFFERKERVRGEQRKPPPHKKKDKEQGSNLTTDGQKELEGSNPKLPPLVAKLTDIQAQNQQDMDGRDQESDEAFRERIRKEIKKVFDGFNKQEYDELISQYQAERERYQENLAREEKELHDRRMDEDARKQADEFSKQREKEIKAMSDKDKADRDTDFKESTKFVKNAFAGNTIIDDTLWMGASIINSARMTVLDGYKLWKLKHDMNDVNAEFLKKTEDIERKAEANKKSLAELKSEYKGYDDMAKRLDAMKSNTQLFDGEERRNLAQQLKVALGNRDFIKERIIERGCSGANALDNHLKEIDEQLEKCKMLRNGADRDRTELSKDMAELKQNTLNSYLEYREAMTEGMEIYQKEKNNMSLAKDLVEQCKEIDVALDELKELRDDVRTTSAERFEIEHEMNYLKEKQERILEQFERRSGFDRGEMNASDYIQEVEKKYLSFEARQDMETYTQQFESHFEEYNSEMKKYLEEMHGKDFANMLEQSRDISNEKLYEMESKLDSYKALKYSVEEQSKDLLTQLRNDYNQTQQRVSEYKLELENPVLDSTKREELDRALKVAERHKDTLQEEITSLDGNKQPNFAYKDYDRIIRNSYDTEMNSLDQMIDKLRKQVSEVKTQQEKEKQKQQQRDFENDNDMEQ